MWALAARANHSREDGSPRNLDQGGRHSAAARRLQDIDAQVSVSTPRELEDAILQGRLHIVITAHLDMTSMPLRSTNTCPLGCESPLPIIQDALSIRGECDGPPDEIDIAVLDRTPGATQLLPFQDRQCLILTHEDLFPIVSYRIWLDNLYLRAVHHNAPHNRDSHIIALAVFSPLKWPLTGEGRRYITRTTFQGDGLGPAVGVWAEERTYIENCTFGNLGGDALLNAAWADGTGNLNAGRPVRIANSTFLDPVRGDLTNYVRTWGNGSVLLTGCTFTERPDVTHPQFYARDNATIYSDDATVRVRTDNGPPFTASPVTDVPQFPPDSNKGFLQRTDPWFENMVDSQGETLHEMPAYPAPLQPVSLIEGGDSVAPLTASPLFELPDDINIAPPAGGGAASGMPVSATIAIAIPAALLLLVFATAALVFMRQRRNRRRRGAASGWRALVAGSSTDRSDTVTGRAVTSDIEALPGVQYAWSRQIAAEQAKSGASMASPMLQSPSRHATSGGTRVWPVELSTYWATTVDFDGPLPRAAAPASSRLDALHAQLDSIDSDVAVLDRYHLLGPNQRRQGGQGVVAFARGVHDDLGYALKFFIDRPSFLAERDMYRSTTLGTLLPQVHAEYDPEATPRALMDGAGHPLPPCIVMERGEGLPDWSKRARPDVFQSVAVLAHVATRLRDMHEGGYVHRDIKPENLMFLPRENRWTVIDFGCTVAVGDVAPLAYTLVYASPETAEAVAAGAKTIVADPAADAWALGVVAFELLTGQSAFNLVTEGRDSVLDKLLGRVELAWEGELAERNPVARRRLGLFREPVLSLLRRDPAHRATLADFCRTVNTVFSSPTTVEQL